MPAYLGDCFGAKVLSAFPQNAGTGYPSHIGYVMLFESQHGTFLGMADASVITEVRTGAVSGVATDLLPVLTPTGWPSSARGAQGRSHLAAMAAVRDIRTVMVFDQNPQAARQYCAEMSAKFGIPVQAAASAREAVEGADIVCTVTPSKEPYLEADWDRPRHAHQRRRCLHPHHAGSHQCPDRQGAAVRRSGGSHAERVR